MCNSPTTIADTHVTGLPVNLGTHYFTLYTGARPLYISELTQGFKTEMCCNVQGYPCSITKCNKEITYV